MTELHIKEITNSILSSQTKRLVLFFQETHFHANHIPNIQNKYYPTWYFDSFAYSKSRGVFIVIHKSLPHQVLDSWRSRDGRALLLKLFIYGKKYTFINLYLPNHDQIKMGIQILTDLIKSAEGMTLVGVDFNFVLDQDLDTTAPHLFQADNQMSKFKDTMDNYQLIDISIYSFYSTVHGTYHRLYFFLINHMGLVITSSSEIGSFIWSEHVPVYLELAISGRARTQWSWRLIN